MSTSEKDQMEYAEQQSKSDFLLRQKAAQAALILDKVIYESQVPKTAKDIEAILKLAIKTHIDKHPGITFFKMAERIKNPDRSETYRILFIKKAKN